MNEKIKNRNEGDKSRKTNAHPMIHKFPIKKMPMPYVV